LSAQPTKTNKVFEKMAITTETQNQQKQSLYLAETIHKINDFNEALDLSESDFSDYLTNLESYEERLARGEIQW
jgi:hypothetical protein